MGKVLYAPMFYGKASISASMRRNGTGSEEHPIDPLAIAGSPVTSALHTEHPRQ